LKSPGYGSNDRLCHQKGIDAEFQPRRATFGSLGNMVSRSPRQWQLRHNSAFQWQTVLWDIQLYVRKRQGRIARCEKKASADIYTSADVNGDRAADFAIHLDDA